MSQHIGNLSPLDGRYARQTEILGRIFSEGGLIAFRLQVEAQWLLFISSHELLGNGLVLSDSQRQILGLWAKRNDLAAAVRVKDIEKTTNHDVKAVEYYMREKLAELGASVQLQAYIHFGCTSEDINNLAYALMLREARDQVLLPQMQLVEDKLVQLAHAHAAVPMLSRTHGQPASPTTMGKEMANFVFRLRRKKSAFAHNAMLGKINGAVGNYNAHLQAFPECNWQEIAESFVNGQLKLDFNPYTTQIENHDSIVEFFQTLQGYMGVLLDLERDMWGYISLGYYKQKVKEGEVGSSTMPHKVNPIDFENAEGNIGLANALAHFFVEKLPVSRWQRDLSDSTVLRSLGSALGYLQLALISTIRGLDKLDLNPDAISLDLRENPEVLAEPVQMCMRRYGVVDAYERLKKATRGQRITLAMLHAIIDDCVELPVEVKQRLKALTPGNYIGDAEQLAQMI